MQLGISTVTITCSGSTYSFHYKQCYPRAWGIHRVPINISSYVTCDTYFLNYDRIMTSYDLERQQYFVDIQFHGVEWGDYGMSITGVSLPARTDIKPQVRSGVSWFDYKGIPYYPESTHQPQRYITATAFNSGGWDEKTEFYGQSVGNNYSHYFK